MKSKAITAIMVTMLLVGVAFCVLPVKAAGVLKIGVIGPMGWPQFDGMRQGAELAQDWINGPGGGIVIDGERFDVQLFFANEHAADNRPDLGVAEMIDLLTVKQVDFVLGGFRTECVMLMREVAMNYKTIFFICGASTNELIDCGTGNCGACVRCDYARYKYLFRVTFSQSTLLKNLVGFLRGYVLPTRLVPLYGSPIKVAVIAENLDWTVDKYNALVYGGALGPQANIVYANRTPFDETDFSPYLHAMHAAQVRLVVHIFSGTSSLAFISQMKASPLKAVACGIDVIGQCSEVWDWTGGGCEYETFLAASGTRTPVSNVGEPYTTLEFWDLYYATYGHAPIYTSFGAYDAMIALHDLLEANHIHPPFNQNAGGRADQLVPIIEATDRNGVLGRFKYTQCHDPFSIEYGPTWPLGYVRPLVVQWQAGRLEVVWPMDQVYSKIWVLPDEPGEMYPYPTDLNQDGEVDDEDLSILQGAFGSYPGHPKWQFAADVVRDNFIDLNDHVLVAYDYGAVVALPLPYCYEGGHLGKPPEHDVAVTSVRPSSTVVDQGYSISINVTVGNRGVTLETFDATAYYGNATITPPQWETFWSMGDVNRDGYINDVDRDLIEVAFGSTPGDPNWCLWADLNLDFIVNNLDLAIWDMHHGLDIWTYFVSGAVVETQTVNNLSPGNSTTLVFTWNTTGVAAGDYTISAYAVPILCEEVDRANNNFGDGIVSIIVTPVTPEDLTQKLIETIETWDLPTGTEKSLTPKLKAVLGLLEQGNEKGAIGKLKDFIKQVEAQRGKNLTNEQADQLTSEAQRIIDLIKG